METDYCGPASGNASDKSDIFKTFYGDLKTAPMIEEFPINCECRYIGQKVEFDMDIICFLIAPRVLVGSVDLRLRLM